MDLRSLNEVIAGLRESRGRSQDVLLKNPRDLKIETGPAKDYQVILEGKTLPLASSGVASVCRLLKMDGKYFQRYPRREEFAEHAQTLLPSACPKGVLLRLQGGSVRGVLPGDYTILDDEQALSLISDLGQRILPNIRGVQATSDRGEGSCYRILFGQSALKKDDIFPVVNLRNSELGFGPLSLEYGTFRLVCSNGSIAATGRSHRFAWSHRGEFRERIEKIAGFLRHHVETGVQTLNAIKTATEKMLPSGREEIRRLQRARWIGQGFAKQAEERLLAGRASKYAVFNALTNAAQGFRLTERLRLETVAHAYLLSRN